MVFSSVIFLFFFLPLTVLLYSLAGRRYRNFILLVASLSFYAWGEGIYLLVMLTSITINYLCGFLMFRSGKKPSTVVLITGISLNIGILAFFKYANFFADNFNILISWTGLPQISLNPVHLPIGISFFTFQAISYIVDIYRREVEPQRNPVDLGLYIALFPQLIAGPIVRYHHIAKEICGREFKLATCAYGVRRFLFGLSKKVLLANPLAEIADKIFSLPGADLSPSLAWLGALCYTLQIYFDFSGYSDMAIGLGRMFGFHFLENFNYPYIARSVREFWRRWHISLSSWLRDYLYIPMGGNRSGELRTYINLLMVFFLCGLWHGASWTFICWGLFHGCFLAIERTRFGDWMSKWWAPVKHFWTLLIVVVGWVIFRSDTIGQAGHYLAMMSGIAGTEDAAKLTVSVVIASKAQVEIAVALFLSMPLYPMIKRGYRAFHGSLTGGTAVLAESVVYSCHFIFVVLLCYLTVISLAAGVYNPFIYFRF
jgi:alginate O-acetyltransferase complex protein AlgI